MIMALLFVNPNMIDYFTRRPELLFRLARVELLLMALNRLANIFLEGKMAFS